VVVVDGPVVIDIIDLDLQIGYEPFPPTQTKFFGSTYLALPNQFTYRE